MKKILAGVILALLAGASQAQIAYAIRYDTRNPTNTSYISRFAPPHATEPCMLVMPPITEGAIPFCARMGTAISIAGGQVSVPVTTGQQGIPGPQGQQGVQGIQGQPGQDGVGTPGAPGNTGATGATGDSAYQLAVANGFIGTQPEWLLSLKGSKGDKGDSGAQGLPGTPAPTFNYSAPTARTVAVSTAYQATNPAKPADISISPSCTNNSTLIAASACTMNVRQSSTAGLTCSTGTVVKSWSSTIALGVAITQGNAFPFDLKLPIGGYFILCPTAGTFTIAAVEQTAG